MWLQQQSKERDYGWFSSCKAPMWRRCAPLEPKPDPPNSGTKKYLRRESVVTILDTCEGNYLAGTLRSSSQWIVHRGD